MTPLRLAASPAQRRLAPFAALPPAARAALVAIGRERRFERGDVLVHQGREAGCLFILLEGHAKLSRDLAVGRTVLLSLFGAGDFCGAVAALAGARADSSVVALEPGRALEIERSALLALLAGEPALVGTLLVALASQLAECRCCVVELTGERVEARFANLFLRLAEQVGEAAPRGVRVPIPLSRQELADLAGTTIESAIRVLSRWHKVGVLETLRGGFLLRDRSALARAAGGRAPSPAPASGSSRSGAPRSGASSAPSEGRG